MIRLARTHGSKLALGCCFALLLTVPLFSQKSASSKTADENTIRELDAQWSKTAGTRDLEATVAYYSDDASVLPPNEPIATGKQAIRAVWATLLVPDASLSWQVTKVEVSRSSDLAYIVGTYQLTMKDPQGKPVTDHGKMVEVWKKQADNKWKVVADIFNSDLPASPLPQNAK